MRFLKIRMSNLLHRLDIVGWYLQRNCYRDLTSLCLCWLCCNDGLCFPVDRCDESAWVVRVDYLEGRHHRCGEMMTLCPVHECR